jgi:hypothetical protein
VVCAFWRNRGILKPINLRGHSKLGPPWLGAAGSEAASAKGYILRGELSTSRSGLDDPYLYPTPYYFEENIMRTIETKVYKFSELPDEAQGKALDNLRDINVDHEWWDIDGLLDLTEDEMNKVGIEPGEIEDVLFSYKINEFDLERGQYLQLDNVIVNNDEAFRKFLKIPKELWDQCSYYFVNETRYANVCLELTADKDDDSMLTKEEENILERAIEIMADKIHAAWVALRNDYEWLISDEAIKDTILANEYEFYENGKLL